MTLPSITGLSGRNRVASSYRHPRTGRRRAPAVSCLALGCLLAAAWGCGRQGETESRLLYSDLLTTGALRARAPAEALFCDGETRFSLPLGRRETVSTELEIRAGDRLHLAACATGGPVTLGIRLVFEEDEVSLGSSEVAGSWQHQLDLSTHGDRRGRLELTARASGDARLHLRDVFVRHRRPGTPLAKGGQDQGPLQVLLISVDTLRQDALGIFGGGETPAIDRLAGQSQVFARHYAAATWTKPTHATLLTGHSDLVHGALEYGSELPASLPTLAERLREAGLRTEGLVHDCVILNPEYGFGRGFGTYRAVPWNLPQLTREVAGWIAEHADQPFFYFLHTFEVHSDFHQLPYEAPDVRQEDVEARFGIREYGCEDDLCASNRLMRIQQGERQALDGEGAVLRYLYDRGVTYLDRSLGELFAELEELGIWERLLVVLTSDHGESFLEHGEVLHSRPWEQVLRVPLIIKWPYGERAGEVSSLPVSTQDVTATLLAVAGLDASDLPGRDLATWRRPRPVVVGTEPRVVIQGPWKAFFDRSGGERLFHLGQDPGETKDLAVVESDKLAELRGILEAYLDREQRRGREVASRPRPRPLSEEEEKRLRSLGYAPGGPGG